MDSRCDVCGCTTENENLKSFNIGGDTFDVCVFCRKHIENARNDTQSARNLLLMDTKGKRSEKCNLALTMYLDLLGINTKTELPLNNKKEEISKPTEQPVSLEQEVEDLKKQVEELDKRFSTFRKRYIISRVLGIFLPVVLTLIMLMILLASGTLQNLFDYYGMLSEYANM